MPSKPRTLAGILRLRRHADRAYNLVQRDVDPARVVRVAPWPANGDRKTQDRISRPRRTDADVRAFTLLHIDSPGGHVAGTKELADDVAAVDQSKPVHAYLEDAGASAAYWIASQARSVTANAMAMVGSLGTFTVLYDLSKAAAMEGVQVRIVSTGERKGAAAPGTPVTDADVAEAQRLVDGFDAFFRAAVRDGLRLAGGRGEGPRARGPGRAARRRGGAAGGAAPGEGGEGAGGRAGPAPGGDLMTLR